MTRLAGSIAIASLVAACGNANQGGAPGAPPLEPPPPEDAGIGTPADASPPPKHDGSVDGAPGAEAGGDAGSDSGTGPAPDAGGDGAACYAESYDPMASLADLASAYASGAWLADSLEAMHRRYSTGYFVLDAEQADPQLPGFADPSSWAALMESLMTMVHEESHGWDFDHSPQAGMHQYVLRDDLQVTVPELTTWPRSEITQYITDNTTQQYDQTYLTGTQGTYDVIFLFEEMNAYTNGLAAITAAADQITQQISARDGVVAHLYYIELYLKDGRIAHAADYAALKADPSWQKLTRYAWARGHFWDGQAAPNPLLDIASSPIWAHVNDPVNLDEIRQFTGDDPAVVACHP
jgi:hypothetical protein